MEGNYYVLFLAALVPMILGFVWYNPKFLGNVWMREAKLSMTDLQGGNMAVIFGVSYLLSVLLAVVVNFITHHEQGLIGIVFDQEIGFTKESDFGVQVLDYVQTIKARYSNFGHGVVHGLFFAVLFVLPIMATNAMFERKSFKYIMVNWGYWALTIAMMGGVLSQWY